MYFPIKIRIYSNNPKIEAGFFLNIIFSVSGKRTDILSELLTYILQGIHQPAWSI